MDLTEAPRVACPIYGKYVSEIIARHDCDAFPESNRPPDITIEFALLPIARHGNRDFALIEAKTVTAVLRPMPLHLALHFAPALNYGTPAGS